MKSYVHILYRLARFLAGVPPELLGALLIVVLFHPAALIAPVVYVVNLLGSEIVFLLLFYVWTWIIWPCLPSKVQGAILRVRDYFLPARPPPVDVPDQVRKLAELRDEEILTEEEFQAKKRDLLDRW